jgi:hypothetical protein
MNSAKPIIRLVANGTRPGHSITDYTFEMSQGERRGLFAVGITDKAITSAKQLSAEARARAAEQWLLKLHGEGEDLFAGREKPYEINMPDGAFHYFANNGSFE